MTRIFVVDDHPLLRQGITQLINNEPDMMVCGEADNPVSAVHFIQEARPDVALLDLSLRGSSGIDLLHQVKSRVPGLKVLILSMHEEMVFAHRALLGGAAGYIMKHEATEKILPAIRQVSSGKVYLSSDVEARLRHRVGHALESVLNDDQEKSFLFKELNAA